MRSLHHTFFKACFALLLGVAALQPAHAAVDPTLKTLVSIVATALGEPALNDALPLIDCVIKSGPAACVNVPGIAESEGKQAAKKFIPTDPLIASAVDIIQAAYAEDWIKVLELTGTDILLQVACKAGLSGGGPVKNFICGGVFKEVSSLAKPLLKQVLITVKNPTPGNLLGLVAVIDPALACKVVPDFPGKDEICGPLGEVIKLAVEVGKEAVKAGKEAGEFLLQIGGALAGGAGGAAKDLCKGVGLCGGSASVTQINADQYYKYFLFPLIHDRVLARLTSGQQNLGHDKASLDKCLKYYVIDVFSACKISGERLHKEADVLAQAFAAAPGPYFEASAKPLVNTFAVEGYGKNKASGYTQFVNTVCVTNMRKTFPIVEPTKPGSTTAWAYACAKVGGLFYQAYTQAEQKLAYTLQQLVAAGCVPPKGWVASQGIKLECDSYPGYQKCLTALAAGAEKKHCSVNQKKADEKLAQEIAKQLGAKRCSAQGLAVQCSRPWKKDKCVTLRAQANPKSAVSCKLIGQVAFALAGKQAQDILNTLNGVKKVGTVQKPGGPVEELVMAPLKKVCSHTFDPLTIVCPGYANAPADAGVSLPGCAPDPNQDGADAPCFNGPLSSKLAPKEVPVGEMPALLLIPKPNAPLPENKGGALLPAPAGGGFAPAAPRAALPAQSGAARGATPTRRPPQGLPDITSAPQILVGATPAQWGAMVNVDAKQAFAAQNGVCQFAIQHTARNIGLAPTGAFDSLFKSSPASGSLSRAWGSIVAGGQDTQKDLLPLKPGMNDLYLTLDHPGKVQESNETNNQFRVRVNLSGDCGAAPGILAPPVDTGQSRQTPQDVRQKTR